MFIVRLRTHNQAEFCWMCDCTLHEGPLFFHCFGHDAPHRATRVSHRLYLQRCAAEGQQPSNIFRVPGLELQHLVVDSMHAGDLGAFCDALGSLFHLECSNKAWHKNQAEGLESLNEMLNAYYKLCKTQTGNRVTPLTWSQILSADPGYPFLKTKAAPCRHLAEFGLKLAYMHAMGTDSRPAFCFKAGSHMQGKTQAHLDLLVDLFRGLERYCRCLKQEPFEEQVCQSSMFLFLKSMAALSKLWREGREENELKRLPFNVRPKCHMLEHLVLDFVPVFGGPSRFWCYRDEDYVGFIKRICAKTKHPATLESRVLLKLRVLEGLQSRALL